MMKMIGIERALLTILLCTGACAVEPDGDPSIGDPALTSCVSKIGGDAACYATFTEAMAAATGGQISNAASDPELAFADGTLDARINALWHDRVTKGDANATPTPGMGGNIVIGIVYNDANFHGKNWVFIATSGCTLLREASWAVQNLNASPYTVSSMNDNISSVKSFADCGTVLYEDWKLNAENPSAGSTLLVETSSYVGDAMNDRASSIAWFRLL
jgi:hypothetical protein